MIWWPAPSEPALPGCSEGANVPVMLDGDVSDLISPIQIHNHMVLVPCARSKTIQSEEKSQVPAVELV